jgi:hypothetical protein
LRAPFFAALRAPFFAAPTLFALAAFILRAGLRAILRVPVAFDFLAAAVRAVPLLFLAPVVLRGFLAAVPLAFALAAAPWVLRRVAISVPFLRGGWNSDPRSGRVRAILDRLPSGGSPAVFRSSSTRTSRAFAVIRGENVTIA